MMTLDQAIAELADPQYKSLSGLKQLVGQVSIAI